MSSNVDDARRMAEAALMAKGILLQREHLDTGGTWIDREPTQAEVDLALALLAALEESDVRRQTLFQVREQQREAWARAERAEAERDELKDLLSEATQDEATFRAERDAALRERDEAVAALHNAEIRVRERDEKIERQRQELQKTNGAVSSLREELRKARGDDYRHRAPSPAAEEKTTTQGDSQ